MTCTLFLKRNLIVLEYISLCCGVFSFSISFGKTILVENTRFERFGPGLGKGCIP